ncbi:MAG: anti-sigma factor family protein [Myxococcota bacterium]
MTCQMTEELTALIDGELPPLRSKQVQAHVGSCAECAQTHTLLRGAVAQLAALPAFQPSANLRRYVMNHLEAPAPWWRALLVPALGMATAATLVVVVSPTSTLPVPQVNEPAQLTVAMNMELLSDLELLGLESAEDLEVVGLLHELEDGR